MKMIALAPIVVKILLWRSRGFGSHKRLKRIAGLAPEKIAFMRNRNEQFSENKKGYLFQTASLELFLSN